MNQIQERSIFKLKQWLPLYSGKSPRYRFQDNVYLSEGVKFLLYITDCHELLDWLAQVPLDRTICQVNVHFLVDVNRQSGMIIFTNNNQVELFKQEWLNTNFPLDNLQLCILYDEKYKTILLPTEY